MYFDNCVIHDGTHMASNLKEWGDVESIYCYVGTEKGRKYDQTFYYYLSLF
jgi:hypothetical protein